MADIIKKSDALVYLETLKERLEQSISCGDSNKQEDRDYFSNCISAYREVSSFLHHFGIFTYDEYHEIGWYRLKAIDRFYHDELAEGAGRNEKMHK